MRSAAGRDATTMLLLFGELLADCFSDGEVPGGAPFNVAHHLAGLAGVAGGGCLQPILVSRIGADARGERLLAACRAAGLEISGIQRDACHASGRVDIRFDGDHGQHHFEIPAQQAWDFIRYPPIQDLIRRHHPERLYFGTLARRGASGQTLQRLVQAHGLAGFLDVNLRPPWADVEIVEASLSQAETVKLNAAELSQLAAWFALTPDDPRRQAEQLLQRFGPGRVLVTRGEQRAWLLDAQAGFLETPTTDAPVQVVDTVGAGDAFAAVFLLGLTRSWPLQTSLQRSHQFAAAVCGLRGAVPATPDFYQPFRRAWGLDREMRGERTA